MKFVRRLIVPFLLLSPLLVCSCVSTKEVPLANPAIMSGKSIAQTSRDKPGFAAVTAGKAATGSLFGAVGGAIAASAMLSAGNEIVNDHGIEDPANGISDDLAAALKQKLGVRVIGKRKITQEKPEDVAKACTGADYALDVRTINWSFVYMPTRWGTYRVIYSSKLRLIDCKTGKVVAEGFKARVPEDEKHLMDYDGLTGNGAAGIKRELKIGAAESREYFRKSILKL